MRGPRELEWTRRDSLIFVAIIVVAGLLRFVRLSTPSSFVFDETYYAKDACLHAGYDQEFCTSPHATEISWVHPPLGKLLIAVGIRIFGFNAFGWRFSAALAGTALAGIVYLLARRLFRDVWIAGAAGLLVATDFLLIVQSRIAMLDIFTAFFVALGFLFLAIDRDRVLLLREHAQLPFPDHPPRRTMEWRLLAGAAFGAGMASKWQAGLGLASGAILALAWSAGLLRQRSSSPNEKRLARSLLRELGVTAAAFVLIPLLVYLLSYAAWFRDNYPHRCAAGQVQRVFLTDNQISCKKGLVGTALAFGELHDSMLDFHANLEAKHPYAATASTWPLVLRPVAYHYQGEPLSEHILAFGNPATWWAAIGASVWLLFRSVRGWRAERVVAAAWGGQYLPWLAVAAAASGGRYLRWLAQFDRPAIFLFYMTPIVPFMMIGLAAALRALKDLGPGGRWAVTAYFLIGVGVLLWFFYPVIAAVGLPYEQWNNRMWFGRWI